MTSQSSHFGINLYGHVSGNFGLAVAARNTLRTLTEQRVDTCVIDIDDGTGRSGHDRTYAHLACSDLAGEHGVSLLHSNPVDLYSYAVQTPAHIWKPDRLRLLVPFWELPKIPDGIWTDFFAAVDMVMAPTLFVAQGVRESCPEARVFHYPQAVFLPDGVRTDRARYGLPADAFVCVSVMDASSGFERKNPLASVEVFRRAFEGLGPDQVRLVVKMNDRKGAKRFAQQIDEFRADAEADPRMTVIEESMSYVDVLSLNSSADVLLSLHRSEGLGLNLMEAMSLGTAVVATGWSGNMDFMTPENSVPVSYDPVDVASVHPSYAPSVIGPSQWWAEPRLDEAARELRGLYDDRTRLAGITARARQDMDDRRQRFLEGRWLAEVRSMLEAGALGSTEHAERSERFARVMHVPMQRRMRRAAGNVLRRVGLL